MKKFTVVLALLALLALPASAAGDKIVPVMTARASNTSVTVDTAGYQTAQVTIWAASGTPDGTVTIYSAAPGAPLITLATYATPTTAKTFRGPAGAGIVVGLSGMSTGAVSVVAVLK